jgi:ribonuclease Z
MGKRFFQLAIIAVISAGLVYNQRAAVIERLLVNAIPKRMLTNTLDELPDGLHVGLCGAGGPMPAPKASGPCVVVAAGQQLFVVDVGTDSPRNLNRMGFQGGDINGVLLTHFHSDHIDGLGELATVRWATGNDSKPLPVYGPPGVEQVVEGFNTAYAQDFIYRNAHHGDAVTPLAAAGLTAKSFLLPAANTTTTVLNSGDLVIEALQVNHAPVAPAVGYRFHYKGRSVLISGDTAKSENLQTLAQGIDLLVHEALAPNIVVLMQAAAEQTGNTTLAKVMEDIPGYHSSPIEAAEIARDAQVGHLLYYHIVPPLLLPGQDALFLNGAEDIFPRYTLGVDGVLLSLPANNRDIVTVRRGL